MTKHEIVGYLVVFISPIPCILAKFMNIDMTSTRFLVEYWYLILLVFIGVSLGGWIIKRGEKEENR